MELNSTAKSIKRFSIVEILISISLLLGSMNFYNRYFVWFYIAVALLLLVNPRFVLNTSSISLGILALSFMLFSPTAHMGVTSMIKPFIYFFTFQIGYNMLSNSKYNEICIKEKSIKYLWGIFTFGMIIYIYLNMMLNINSTDRNIIDFWTRAPSTATGQAVLGCIPIAVFVATLMSKNNWIWKLISFIGIFYVMYYNLILAGRTLIAMLLIVISLSLLFLLKYENNNKTKNRVLLSFLLLVILLFLLYVNNAFGIQEMLFESNFYDRFFGENTTVDLDEDGRGELKKLFLKNIISYPFGGANIRETYGGYAHDLFLDTYDEAGVFAFISIVIYVLASLQNVYRLMKNKTVSFPTKQIIICTYAIMLIEFFLEPILIGVQWFFAIFCFMDGCIYKLSLSE